MELIPINESKLKIMLDESDMREYNIGDEADCANSETRLAIRHILDRAKDQIGFNTEGSEIFVQLYTSKRGGCELFVTKSTIPSDAIIASATVPEKKTKKRNETSSQKALPDTRALPANTRPDPRSKRKDSGRIFYSFDNLESMCRVCRLLDNMNIPLESSAHKGDDGIFYLILEGENVKEFSRLDNLTFILEFGERERGCDTYTYLCEHSSVISGSRAVSLLAQF